MNFLTTLSPLLAGLALAYVVYQLTTLGATLVRPDPLTEYAGVAGGSTITRLPWHERTGLVVAQKLPFSLDLVDHLRWAKRGGKYLKETLGTVVFKMLAFGGLAGLAPLMNPTIPALWLAPFLAAALPFIQIRAAANKAKRRAVRATPELAALIAAEMAANTPPETALEDALKLPGSLTGLLEEAGTRGRQTGRPLLSHGAQVGVIREVFDETRVPALRAFAVQLDLAASTGLEGAQRMQEISKTLASEYRQQLLESTETLEDKLVTAISAFYFAPMMLLILAAFFGAVSAVI